MTCRCIEIMPRLVWACTGPDLPDVVYVEQRASDGRWTPLLDDRIPPGAIWYNSLEAAINATKDWSRT
jgi:hypothetical protein